MSETGNAAPSQRMVGFADAVKLGFKNYFNFNGRSSRGAYWYWTLALIIFSFVTSIIDMILFPGMFAEMASGPVSLIFNLAIIIPCLAVTVRRLHDVGRSGWWYLLVFTIIGVLLILFWIVQPGQRKENAFGPDYEAGR